jgi:hypothetical protein
LQKEKQRKTTRESAQRSKEKRAQSSEWLQSGRKAVEVEQLVAFTWQQTHYSFEK